MIFSINKDCIEKMLQPPCYLDRLACLSLTFRHCKIPSASSLHDTQLSQQKALMIVISYSENSRRHDVGMLFAKMFLPDEAPTRKVDRESTRSCHLARAH